MHPELKGTGGKGLNPGDVFPSARLGVIRDDRDREYLGLKPGRTGYIDLNEIEARLLLISLYDHATMTAFEDIHSFAGLSGMIADDPDLNPRVRSIMVEKNGRIRDTLRFRQEESIAIPMLADPEKALFERLGEPFLPAIYLLRKQSAECFLLVESWTGGIPDTRDGSRQVKSLVLENEAPPAFNP